MTTEERIMVFTNFLKSKSCYDEFLENCKLYKQSHRANDMPVLVSKSNPYHAIANAFNWRKTPEGHDYWYGLAMEFRAKFITSGKHF